MLLHETVCRQHMIFPQVREDGRIVVAVPEDANEQRVRVILAEHGITQCEIERREYEEILASIDRQYPPERAEEGASTYDEVKQIIREAAANGIEDISFEPWGDQGVVRFIKREQIVEERVYPQAVYDMYAQTLILHAGMQERQKRGSGRLTIEGLDQIAVRLIMTRTHDRRRSIEVRLLPSEMRYTVADCIAAHQRERLQVLQQIGNGLIIIAGPPGHGKSTLARAMLYERYQQKNPKPIIRGYESPPEVIVPWMRQYAFENPTELEEMIDDALRMQTKYLFIGEARNTATFAEVLRAARTGICTITTMHGLRVSQVIERILYEVGMPWVTVHESLRAIIAVRRVGRLCPSCVQRVPLSDQERTQIAAEWSQIPAAKGWALPTETTVAAGCLYCRQLGVVGRTPIAEIWMPERSPSSVRTIDEILRSDPQWTSLRAEGYYAATHRGETSLTEVHENV
jgi:type II secretory ATPase GspE/PulE/Tfp pilus assembly ATPase PilB-like protein